MENEARMKAIIAALLEDGGRTEAEAAGARAQAARLMVKHGLTEADVLSATPDMKTGTYDVGRYQWMVAKFIAGAIAKLTGTCAYSEALRTSAGRRSDRKRFSFAGYRPDVEQAEWLFSHIIDAGDTAAKGVGGDKAKSDLLAAFAVTVSRRLKMLQTATDEVRAEAGGTDLVVVKDAKVNEYVEQSVGKLCDGRAKGRRTQDQDAAARGREAGQKVSLARGVGSGPLAIGKQ